MVEVQEDYKEDHYYILVLSVAQLIEEGKEPTPSNIRQRCVGVRIGPKLRQLSKYRILEQEGEKNHTRYYPGAEFEKFHSYYKKKYQAPL